MEYRRLGRSGLKVGTIGLGSWLTIGNVIEQRTSDRIVKVAFERGVNLFDTADIYNKGEGERGLGRAVRTLPRERLVLASKVYFPMSDDPNDRGLSRKHVLESLDATLDRLGTDYLDLYQCHRPDPETPIEETAMAMDDLIRRGKVLYWGVSCWSPSDIAWTVGFCRENGLHAPISNQPPYNLLDRHIEHEVIPACERYGLGQIVYSPLAQGVLTGKYRRGEDPREGTRAADERLGRFVERYLDDESLSRVEAFVEIANEIDAKPAQLAVRWTLEQSNVASAIVGASGPEQIEETLGALELDMTPELVARIEDAFA